MLCNGTMKIQMSTLIVLFVMATFIQGLPAEGIPKIKLFHLKLLDPPGFEIQWHPIEYGNDTDPVIGIKVKVWKTPCKIRTIFHHDANGKITKIVKSERLKFNDTTLPQVLPENVVIVKPGESSATVPHIDSEVWYHVRALAFTKTEEGPHSNPVQFKNNTYDENDMKKSCERIISETPVEDESYNDD